MILHARRRWLRGSTRTTFIPCDLVRGSGRAALNKVVPIDFEPKSTSKHGQGGSSRKKTRHAVWTNVQRRLPCLYCDVAASKQRPRAVERRFELNASSRVSRTSRTSQDPGRLEIAVAYEALGARIRRTAHERGSRSFQNCKASTLARRGCCPRHSSRPRIFSISRRLPCACVTVPLLLRGFRWSRKPIRRAPKTKGPIDWPVPCIAAAATKNYARYPRCSIPRGAVPSVVTLSWRR